MSIVGTFFQPRLLDNPEKPSESPWDLAILDPDNEQDSFPTYEIAMEEAKLFSKETGKPLSNIVIAKIDIDYLQV